ncbi:peroxin 14 [Trypanosoma conorhini]|uniref:Peroxisomal membrane protein PEX14 n=1 Tax=Trypanosoma conorhini TaxID=83891 RepID=A0A3R7P3G9_9TRYP|nr:peroxin 14 [Trypanosoma conorhini]RNF12157.1 peroxin 14 [Trypanosoma conorhini]
MNTLTADAAEANETQQRMDSGESEKSKRVSSAVQFLHDPRVKFTPAANKIRFLMTKGLTAEEMYEAFEKAGQTTSLDEIKNAMNAPSVVGSRSGVVNVAAAPGNNGVGRAGYLPRQDPLPTYGGPLYAPQPPPLPPMPQETKELDWRDVVIGVGAALLTGFGAVKAFQAYSPYEIRRKDENAILGARGEVRRRGRRHEEDVPSERKAGDRVPPSHSLPHNPPATLPPLPAAATAEAVVANTAAGITELEVQELRMELKETQEALEKEKKSKAELSLNNSKLRAQFTATTRKNEKLELRVKTLQEELDKAKGVPNSQTELCETVTGAAAAVTDPQQDVELQPNGPRVSSPSDPTDALDHVLPEPKETPLPTAAEVQVAEPQQDVELQPNDPRVSSPADPTDALDHVLPEPKETPLTTAAEGVQGVSTF